MKLHFNKSKIQSPESETLTSTFVYLSFLALGIISHHVENYSL